MEKEPIEKAELFADFESLSQIGRNIGDQEARADFIAETLKSRSVSGEAMAAIGKFIRSIDAEAASATEQGVEEREKQALYLRQRILPQVAKIILLLDTRNEAEDTGNDELAQELHSLAMDELAQLADDIGNIIQEEELAHHDYFAKIHQKVLRIIG